MQIWATPLKAVEIKDILQTLLPQSHYEFLVMEEKQQLLGFIVHAKLYFVERAGTYHRILALVVSKNHRHKGIATALMNAVKEKAEKDGSMALTLNSGMVEERRAAHTFYQNYGFHKGSYGFVYEFDEISTKK